MPTLPDIVRQLIGKFENDLDHYLSPAYNETLCRVDFINPMFEALGWDMSNRAGYADAYRDVIHEDAIKIGGATKAPDYCFRIGGTRKFFLEAKKPGVALKNNPEPAFQLRRYAWSAKLPLSILTDFQEFAVYDCRVRPSKDDKPSVARIFYCTCDQYPDKWAEIAAIFARESILKGSFDRYAESARGKRGTAEVDAAFLKEIEGWRDKLARNLALRNQLSQRDLNFAVQRIIDRIIFLRIAEDRGVETYAALQGLVNGPRIYERLLEVFHRADERYNSGLFHFQPEKGRNELPDELTPGLSVDGKVLREIIRGLYYPESPYEFSVLGADILGQVYEQFLGKVIRLTGQHRAVVEEKPEVRKAGGVYYTPTYIVDYIVRNTVGRLLEGGECSTGVSSVGGRVSCPPSLTPREAARLRILDPACGSGSFLIGAYQYLLDWHLDWYIRNDPEKHAKGRKAAICRSRSGGWRLTTAKRKEILLNNIYGVDIDPQAVEVTKLSLLLKVLEGETGETLNNQLRLFHERALPDLGDNIKCGNSLIGPDFYDNEQMNLLDVEEKLRINVFDWKKEFAPIMKAGGFDVVIGNPPYIRMEAFKPLKDYLRAQYRSHDERADIYVYFIEKAHELLRTGGRFGVIVSNKFLRANYGRPLREFLRKTACISRIVDFAGLPVFAGATVRTIVLLAENRVDPSQQTLYSPPLPVDLFSAIQAGSLLIDEAIRKSTYAVHPAALGQPFWSFCESKTDELISSLQKSNCALKDYCDGRICRGIVSGLNAAFVIDDATKTSILRQDPRAAEIIKPFLNGRDVRRYSLQPKGRYLIYTCHGVDIKRYPGVVQYLRPFKDRLEKRATKQEWYELQQPQMKFIDFFNAPKIIFPDISTEPRFTLDDDGYYGANTVYFIPLRDLYLLGLLNSSLAFLYFKTTCAGLESKSDTYLRFFGQYLEDFPVRRIDASDPRDKTTHGRMVALVDQMLSLHRQLSSARTAYERDALQRQIDATDARIDRLVYELYGLTEEEIRIVEEATAHA